VRVEGVAPADPRVRVADLVQSHGVPLPRQRSRRGRVVETVLLAGAAGAAFVAISGSDSAQAAVSGFGRDSLSGLPWNSGCSLDGIKAFEAYRGRKADTYTLWFAHQGWSEGRMEG